MQSRNADKGGLLMQPILPKDQMAEENIKLQYITPIVTPK